MNRALWKKCIAEAQWLFLACAAALYAFCWVRVWLVSRFEMSRFQTVIEQFREFERFSPVPFDHLFTYPGRIAVTYDEPIVILCVSVWAVARGSDAISGELNRGTMEMMLAQPVSRLQTLATQASVTVAGTALLALVTWLGAYTGIATTSVKEELPQPRLTIPLLGVEVPSPLTKPKTRTVAMSEKVDPRLLVPAAANLFALGFCLAGISTFASSWDRYRWRTIGIVVGFYVVEMIAKVVAVATSELRWMLRCTFFTAYEPEAFVRVAVRFPEETWHIMRYDAQGQFADLGPWGYDLLLLGIGAAAYILAAAIFCQRDLPAPL